MTPMSKPEHMEILAREMREHGFTLTCRVPENLKFLDGHFRRAPVVAGVVQVFWAMEAIRTELGEQPGFNGMEALKFHHLLFPGDHFTLDLERGNGGKWSFKLQAEGKKISSGRLVTQAPANP